VSSFAGECTMDAEGNLYFVHHYFSEDMTMIEADIYVAYKLPSTAKSLTDEPGDLRLIIVDPYLADLAIMSRG
jgi:hypothetical protein